MENKKVMIIDDDLDFLVELKESLSLSGFDMIAYNDPAEALSAAADLKPEVILLDLKMPKMSGFQLADEIKHHYQLLSIPIIAMSAYFKDEYVPLMNICGIRKCLKKPFTPLEVITEIEKALEGKQTF